MLWLLVRTAAHGTCRHASLPATRRAMVAHSPLASTRSDGAVCTPTAATGPVAAARRHCCGNHDCAATSVASATTRPDPGTVTSAVSAAVSSRTPTGEYTLMITIGLRSGSVVTPHPVCPQWSYRVGVGCDRVGRPRPA